MYIKKHNKSYCYLKLVLIIQRLYRKFDDVMTKRNIHK